MPPSLTVEALNQTGFKCESKKARVKEVVSKLNCQDRKEMKKRIKIAYLVDTIGTSTAGTEKQLLEIARRINSKEIEIIFICLYQSNWLKQNQLPVRSYSLGYRGILKVNLPIVLVRYLEVIKRENVDIVQTFFNDAIYVGFVAKLLRSKPILITSRRDMGLTRNEDTFHKLNYFMLNKIDRFYDYLITNSEELKKFIIKKENVVEKKIKVIHNGVSIPSGCNQFPSRHYQGNAQIRITVVANLKPIKRIDLLLDSLSYLKSKYPEFSFKVTILGDGAEREKLVNQTEVLGLSSNVVFKGSVENVVPFMKTADIGVLCSDKEGFSNALLEYMACGLPVVVTDIGGNQELVDSTNGISVPVDNYMALAEAIHKIGQSSELRKAMAANSLNRVYNRYSWDKIIPQWEGFYKAITSNKSRN